jgi:hypothetical protein
MKKSIVLLEILVGLLTLIIGIITMYPLRFFNVQTGAEIMMFGIPLLGVTMLIVGIFRLTSVFSFETLSLAKKN